jgi:hypothetical protein
MSYCLTLLLISLRSADAWTGTLSSGGLGLDADGKWFKNELVFWDSSMQQLILRNNIIIILLKLLM